MLKRILLLCLLLLLPKLTVFAQAKHEEDYGTESSYNLRSVYIVQSNNVTELYGDSLVRELKHRNPEYKLNVLFARDFNQDQFYFSKEYTEREIQKRSESYDNLILLGYDLSYLQLKEQKPIHIPILVTSSSGKPGPASPESMIEGIKSARRHLKDVSGTVYVISDGSRFSQLRLRQFKDKIEKERILNLVSVQVSNVIEFRTELSRLNGESKSFLINNTFNLLDRDSQRLFFVSSTTEILTEINKKHVEVGVLRWKQPTALGFGVLPGYMASIIKAEIEGEDYSRRLQTGVNLDRVGFLGVNGYVLSNSKEIVYITVDDL